MDELNRQFIARMVDLFHLQQVVASTGRTLLFTAGMFVAIGLLELLDGVDLSRYRSRNFLVDIFYGLFYNAGIYTFLIYAPLASVLQPKLAFLQFNLVQRMPLALGLTVYWLMMDCLNYWVHRFQHTRYWWRFHALHHSQERLTFMSAYRFHPMDQLLGHVAALVPVLIVGVPVVAWLPYRFLTSFIDATHHSALTWRLGPFRWLFVSPVFHSVHHSAEPAHANKNYSGLLSIWDYLFGTAVDAQARPVRTGVPGWSVPESVLEQCIAPFRGLGSGRQAQVAEIVPQPSPGDSG